MNLPNSLTIARMVLVPLLVVVLLTEFEGSRIAGVPKELVAAAIFGIASLTDWLDGYLARRRRQMPAAARAPERRTIVPGSGFGEYVNEPAW